MTEQTINNLPEQFKDCICTLKRASSDTTNQVSMCESKMLVVNFDKIPNKYAQGKGWSGVPKSNDALYIDVEGKWYFIEFKNGTVQKDEVYRKLYDSLIMLMEWKIIPDFDFAREHIRYILVYNDEKYGKIQRSQARERNYGYFVGLAQQEERLFDIDKFEGYLLNEVHTYTKDLFETYFVRDKEKEEGQ